MQTFSYPTDFSSINTLLISLLNQVRAILGELFLGFYVHGSLAYGGFEPGRSDIDFLVVTTSEIPEALLPALADMHTHLHASGLSWADKLEGSYIPQAWLRRHDPEHNCFPALRVDGSFDIDRHGSDWIIQRSLIREHALVLAGPDPKTLIDPVGPDDLRQAVRGILVEWWAPKLQDHTLLLHDEYQSYAVLTMCRALHTLHFGIAAPKLAAAEWAQTALDPKWKELIIQATGWRYGLPMQRLDEVLDFIRYTLKRALN